MNRNASFRTRVNSRRRYAYPSMTLRDYFAAHALSAMTCAPDYSKGPCNGAIAARAYVIADAMLVQRSIERNKETQ